MTRNEAKIENEPGDVFRVYIIQTRIAETQATTLSTIRTLCTPFSVTRRNAPKLTREYTRSDVALPSDATGWGSGSDQPIALIYNTIYRNFGLYRCLDCPFECQNKTLRHKPPNRKMIHELYCRLSPLKMNV